MSTGNNYWQQEVSMTYGINLLIKYQQHVKKTYRCKSKPKDYDTPWMDKDTLSAVQNKRKMWKKYKYCRSPHNKDHAKTVSSMKVREAQARYEKSVALKAKEDPKVFWRHNNPRQK